MVRAISQKKQKVISNINLIWILALKNFKVRYKNSILGFLWSLITPLLYLAIFIFVFSNAFPDLENYPLFALTGLIFWNFFSHSTRTAIDSVIASSGIIKSINIQKMTLPISEVLTSMINLLLSLIPFSILMMVLGAKVSVETLLIIPLIILFTAFTLGVGIFLCSFNVFFRDVGLLYSSLITALFYFTPIAYSTSLVPSAFVYLLKLNPLYHFIEGFRLILYYNEAPSLELWLIASAISLISLGIGAFAFKKLERGFISNF